ncbi:MAG: hypothetical protein Q4F88_04360 [Eubacteriales bacterium]|nr:hypothetical protein [Eubacteriales bacterium]
MKKALLKNTKRIIDANIILRYILKDDENDFEIAKKEILKGATTSIAIIAEVVYVLKGVYNIPQQYKALVFWDT